MTPAEFNKELAERIGGFFADPHGFVMFAFPWGVKGGPLEDQPGPDEWQRTLLTQLGEHIQANRGRKALKQDMEAWWSAVASGHGVGKSALVAWLIIFIMATRIDARGVVTANTENQLQSKTWPEVAKWHGMFIAKDWFKWTATQYYYALYPEEKRKNYCISAIPWSEENTEGFAGLHNANSAVLVILDEASSIPGKIWEVVEGSMTDGEPFWFAFGNPTRRDGRFFECFNRFKNFWRTRAVDSRSVRITNKTYINRLIDQYGVDSDEVRVRVRGMFPAGSANGYISADDVSAAMSRELTLDPGAPLIMAVDVARYGDDSTVIRFRQGRDGRSIPPMYFTKLDTQQIAAKVCDLQDKFEPDATVIEGVGVGGGVCDALKHLNRKYHEINPGRSADNKNDYANIRCELYGRMRTWLANQGSMDDPEQRFASEATAVTYTYNKATQLQLETKKSMKDRGLPSPDDADAMALTFAVKVPRRDKRTNRNTTAGGKIAKGVDYVIQ